ncbi:sigma-70 family RNA polymerase sigma factor [Candidatus Accumulibacter sp. ACC003]|uniref:sigma-70 family RNA polymerase sigma factor n=1 Tax=Candidatus Accumulibacter sp. ACC003 TaxID=2823334 RepID=UPI0025C1905C|nr:sigma-70 family RNA polymerase sigma factor [Candidatus Accumulibacter sp. ACC003]
MSQALTLEGLIGRIALGDREALRAAYEASSARLFPIALRLLGDRSLAEDALQEAYLALWHHAGRYRPERAPALAWLTTLVRNKALDIARARPTHLPLERRDAQGASVVEDAPSDGLTPEEALLQRCEDERLKHCLGELDEDRRQVLLLAYYGGHSHRQLAERLAQPLGTIKAWIRRSVLRLQTCMEH